MPKKSVTPPKAPREAVKRQMMQGLSKPQKRVRDYKKEYAEFQGKPQQKKNRALRNAAHGALNPPAGMEVHHKVPLKKSGPAKTANRRSNLAVISRKKNRELQ
jgi:hypothetical protein